MLLIWIFAIFLQHRIALNHKSLMGLVHIIQHLILFQLVLLIQYLVQQKCWILNKRRQLLAQQVIHTAIQ